MTDISTTKDAALDAIDAASAALFGISTRMHAEVELAFEEVKAHEQRGDEITVELLRRLWEEPLVDFEGSFDRVDRAALNPRPRRRIPIWFGGFAEAALRRAAALGDGFIFSGNGLEQVARLKQFVREAGRREDHFGLQNNIRAKRPQDVVDSILRWRDAGGTHASVLTMGQNFTSTDQHIDHMKVVADSLRSSGLNLSG